MKPGDEVAAAADLYGGTFRLLERVMKPWGLVARYTDDPTPAGFEKIMTSATKIVWIETPTNPLLQILDIAALAELAHKKGTLLAVDNTFASPYLQRPLAAPWGRSRRSQHDDSIRRPFRSVVGGHAVIGAKKLLEPIQKFYQNAAGGVPGPFDAYLTLRGLKTLAVRMDRHCANAIELAGWLKTQKTVDRVYYPGLPEHPGHAIAARHLMQGAKIRSAHHDLDAARRRHRGGEALHVADEALHPGRKPRRRRIAAVPSGHDDARQHSAGVAAKGPRSR